MATNCFIIVSDEQGSRLILLIFSLKGALQRENNEFRQAKVRVSH